MAHAVQDSLLKEWTRSVYVAEMYPNLRQNLPAEKYNRRQRDIAAQTIFEDHISFQVTAEIDSAVAGIPATDSQEHDWEEPEASFIDLGSILVQGLRYVGGIDISFRTSGGDGNDGVVCFVILEYPSLTVSDPRREWVIP